ncbi:putative exosome complex component rrp40, partial [Tetrabaena socialis]
MSAPALGKVVGPGDKLLEVPAQGTLRLSAGLTTHEGSVISTKGGILKATRTGQLYLEGRQKRYIPAEGDVVVGVIVDKHSEVGQHAGRGAGTAGNGLLPKRVHVAGASPSPPRAAPMPWPRLLPP